MNDYLTVTTHKGFELKKTSENRYDKKCPLCGSEFSTDRKAKIFCSRKCIAKNASAAAVLNRKSAPVVIKICQNCSNQFSIFVHQEKTGSRKGKFCSLGCYHRFVSKGAPVPYEKACTKCNTVYRATLENFSKISKIKSGMSSVCRKCTAENARIINKPFRDNLRIQVLGGYSGGDIKCACCGEGHIEFLTLDHVNGGGTKERKKYPGQSLFHKLRREGFPPGYRVLCFNCNWCVGRYGYCPHQKDGTNTDVNFFIPGPIKS